MNWNSPHRRKPVQTPPCAFHISFSCPGIRPRMYWRWVYSIVAAYMDFHQGEGVLLRHDKALEHEEAYMQMNRPYNHVDVLGCGRGSHYRKNPSAMREYYLFAAINPAVATGSSVEQADFLPYCIGFEIGVAHADCEDSTAGKALG